MGKGDDPNAGCGTAFPAVGDLVHRRALTDPVLARDLVLARDVFRGTVFFRDRHRCVICGRAAAGLDAHHLLERRLFGAGDPRPGGYVLANGATVCSQPHPDGSPSCHLQAEMTVISPARLRAATGIADVVLPAHLSAGDYTKWGDEVLRDGRRIRGELFHDESVQAILARGGMLSTYLPSVKYPRTPHLWFSPGATSDDIRAADTSMFDGHEVVVTAKLDGECTTVSRDLVHARSLDSGYHPGRTWVKRLWSQIAHDIPAGWRLVGENMQATHSRAYSDLPGHFLLFAVFDEAGRSLCWDDVQEWAGLLDLPAVPVLYRGVWDEQHVRGLRSSRSQFGGGPDEGFVVRRAGMITPQQFQTSVAKYVAADFTAGIGDQHWQARELVENQLAADARQL